MKKLRIIFRFEKNLKVPGTKEKQGGNYDKYPSRAHYDQTELEQPEVATLNRKFNKIKIL